MNKQNNNRTYNDSYPNNNFDNNENNYNEPYQNGGQYQNNYNDLQYNNQNYYNEENNGAFYNNEPYQNDDAQNYYNQNDSSYQNFNSAPYQNNNESYGGMNQNNYNNQNNPYNNNYPPQNPKKKSVIPVIITAVVTFVVLVVAMYFGYTKFIKKDNVADLSTYEVNFVTYGAEGEGKPEVDIKKVPTVANSTAEISNFLSNPTITYDKQSNLKNGDKVEVTITLNQNTANKLNLKTAGEFKRTFTVNGLNEKAKDKETIIVREGNSNSSNSSSSTSSSNSNRTSRNGSVAKISVDAGVNLRSSSNDSSTILATAKKGDTVYVDYTEQNSSGETWAYVSYNGKNGWMRADLIGY